MSNTTSENENSSTPKPVSRLQKKLSTLSPLSPAEIARRAEGAARCEREFSSIPWYAEQAAKDPDYWKKFYESRVNW